MNEFCSLVSGSCGVQAVRHVWWGLCLRKRAWHGKPESPVPLPQEQHALSRARAVDRNERWQRIHFSCCFL